MIRKLVSRSRHSILSIPIEHRTELIVLSALAILAFIFLRWCYPMGAYCLDSADYVYSAELGHMRGYRPVGYPWFLQLIHLFSEKMSTVLYVQFFIYLGSSLFFVSTIRKIFPPVRLWLFRLFALFTVLNTSGMGMSIWYMSDCLNASLILTAFAAMLRLQENPKNWSMSALMVVTLLYATETRFASFFFAPAFILSLFIVLKFRKALPHIAMICIGVGGVWFYNVKMNEHLFGERIFSGFSGWANANNVSVIVPYVKPDTASWAEADAKRAYRVFTTFPEEAFAEEKMLAADFMWLSGGPGKKFMSQVRSENPDYTYEQAWVRTGSVYAKFASHMIREFPGMYAQKFIWPNAKQMFSPRRDLAKFPELKVPPTFIDYYHVPNKVFSCRWDILAQANTWVLERYQVLFALFFPALVAIYFLRKRLNWKANELIAMRSLAFIVVISLAGLLIAHPIMFRYVGWYTLFFLVPVYALVNALLRSRINKGSLPGSIYAVSNMGVADHNR